MPHSSLVTLHLVIIESQDIPVPGEQTIIE